METEKIATRRELSTVEASQLSGLSLNQITHLLRQGKLEGRRFGRRLWIVYADSLEHYLATPHKSGPKGPRKKPEQEPTTTTVAESNQNETEIVS